MKFLIFCIYDKVASSFGEPKFFINEGLAARYFMSMCNQTEEIKTIASDLDVYQLGSFDSSTGNLESDNKFLYNLGGLLNG